MVLKEGLRRQNNYDASKPKDGSTHTPKQHVFLLPAEISHPHSSKSAEHRINRILDQAGSLHPKFATLPSDSSTTDASPSPLHLTAGQLTT